MPIEYSKQLEGLTFVKNKSTCCRGAVSAASLAAACSLCGTLSTRHVSTFRLSAIAVLHWIRVACTTRNDFDFRGLQRVSLLKKLLGLHHGLERRMIADSLNSVVAAGAAYVTVISPTSAVFDRPAESAITFLLVTGFLLAALPRIFGAVPASGDSGETEPSGILDSDDPKRGSKNRAPLLGSYAFVLWMRVYLFRLGNYHASCGVTGTAVRVFRSEDITI